MGARGSRTALPARRLCERLAAVLSDVSTRTIHGAGNMAPLTHREQVNALILAHLDAFQPSRHASPVAHRSFTPIGEFHQDSPQAPAMSIVVETLTPRAGTPDFAAIKQRQQATWASGDFAVIGTTLQIVGEQLAEAADVRAGERVLDVAAGNGNGNATLAARAALPT